MKKYFSEEKLLSTFQSAYTKNHSTGTVLLDITDFVFESFDKGEIVILFSIDYSKYAEPPEGSLWVPPLGV